MDDDHFEHEKWILFHDLVVLASSCSIEFLWIRSLDLNLNLISFEMRFVRRIAAVMQPSKVPSGRRPRSRPVHLTALNLDSREPLAGRLSLAIEESFDYCFGVFISAPDHLGAPVYRGLIVWFNVCGSCSALRYASISISDLNFSKRLMRFSKCFRLIDFTSTSLRFHFGLDANDPLSLSQV